jgi:hypothetical protein
VEIPAPGNSKLEFPARNSGPFIESCTTARDKGLSEKSRGPEILEFLAPNQRVAPQPFVRDLAEFLRARNYGISGPFIERCTITFCKGLSRILKGRKFMKFLAPGDFVKGRNFWPWKFLSSGLFQAFL